MVKLVLTLIGAHHGQLKSGFENLIPYFLHKFQKFALRKKQKIRR